MADLNEVIYSLECCKDIHKAGRMASGCSFCFYRHKGIPECFLSLAADAQELLKEQEPHLLTVEELEALPVGAVVWEESLDVEGEITRIELYPVMKTENGNLIGTNGHTTITEGMYEEDVDGNMWRWWSAKPTDEQRKAVKWDG